MKDLTQVQKTYLVFVINYRAAHGNSPTLKEMSTHFAVSTRACSDVIKALVRKEALSTASRQARALLPGRRLFEFLEEGAPSHG